MNDYQKMREKLLKKIDRDFNQKIFFPEAKKAAEPLYQSWQQVIQKIVM